MDEAEGASMSGSLFTFLPVLGEGGEWTGRKVTSLSSLEPFVVLKANYFLSWNL